MITEVASAKHQERADTEELKVYARQMKKDQISNEAMSNGSDPRHCVSDGDRSSDHEDGDSSSWAKIVAQQHAQIEKMRKQMSIGQEERNQAVVAMEESIEDKRASMAAEAARMKADIKPKNNNMHDSASLEQSHVTTEQLQKEIQVWFGNPCCECMEQSSTVCTETFRTG